MFSTVAADVLREALTRCPLPRKSSVLSLPTHHLEEGSPSRRLPAVPLITDPAPMPAGCGPPGQRPRPAPGGWARAWSHKDLFPGGRPLARCLPLGATAGPRQPHAKDAGGSQPWTSRQPGAGGSALQLRQRCQLCPDWQVPVSRHLHRRGDPHSRFSSHIDRPECALAS